MQINIEKADILNFITAMEYLKDILAAQDVSGDFATEPEDTVTGWNLLTDTSLYSALLEAAE